MGAEALKVACRPPVCTGAAATRGGGGDTPRSCHCCSHQKALPFAFPPSPSAAQGTCCKSLFASYQLSWLPQFLSSETLTLFLEP